QIGFTSTSFGKPAAANFAFRPPAGAAVVQESTASAGKAAGSALGSDITTRSRVIGNGWLGGARPPLAGGQRPGARPGRPGVRAVRQGERIGGPGPRRLGRGGARHRNRRDL